MPNLMLCKLSQRQNFCKKAGYIQKGVIYSGNNALKYASDIEFNVGFDGTAIWFLTED